VFDTVEINNSFYRLPSASAFAAWREQAPPDFVYAVKAIRFLPARDHTQTPMLIIPDRFPLRRISMICPTGCSSTYPLQAVFPAPVTFVICAKVRYQPLFFDRRRLPARRSASLALMAAAGFNGRPDSPCAWREHCLAKNTRIRTIVMDLLNMTLRVTRSDAVLARSRLSRQVVKSSCGAYPHDAGE
jgi:hypothetical protein